MERVGWGWRIHCLCRFEGNIDRIDTVAPFFDFKVRVGWLKFWDGKHV